MPDTPPFDQNRRDNPDLNLPRSNVGKVARKRVDGDGRQIQIGIRFMFEYDRRRLQAGWRAGPCAVSVSTGTDECLTFGRPWVAWLFRSRP